MPVKPNSKDVTSIDVQGKEQTGKPVFNAGHPEIEIDEKVAPTFEDGTTTKTVEGQGTYTIAPDGTVTFTPEPQFIGKATPVTVVRQDTNGTKITATYTPEVLPVKPTATPETTTDVQGKPQTAKVPFVAGDDAVPMDDTVPATFKDGSTTKTIDGEGFVGTATPVTVVRQDKNGTKAEATYTPTVTPVKPVGHPEETEDIQGKEQSAKVEFEGGDKKVPMDDTVPAKLIDPKTGKEVDSVTVDGEGTYTVKADGTVTFQPEPQFVGKAKGVEVVRQDINGTKATAKYTPTVTPVKPTATPKETSDKQGKTQTGKVDFTAGSSDVPMDDAVPAKLIDPETGKEVDSVTIDGEGTYTVAPDGTVTFVPEKDFVGEGTGVDVVRVDKNGTKAKAKYTPTVTGVTPKGEHEVTIDKQGKTQSALVPFKAGADDVPMDDTVPATFKDGSTTKTIAGEGTYTVAPDGTVTFVPEQQKVHIYQL